MDPHLECTEVRLSEDVSEDTGADEGPLPTSHPNHGPDLLLSSPPGHTCGGETGAVSIPSPFLLPDRVYPVVQGIYGSFLRQLGDRVSRRRRGPKGIVDKRCAGYTIVRTNQCKDGLIKYKFLVMTDLLL